MSVDAQPRTDQGETVKAAEVYELDALRFPLHGCRLIEASAGTGKTFTITTLYLRLLLGHGGEGASYSCPLGVNEILVVTFTEAATAELRERIRQRIHEARLSFLLGASDDPVIAALLRDFDDLDRGQLLLLQAERQMDEAAIYTIHGFCQRILVQNAFESGSLFSNEFVGDEKHLCTQVVTDYWRQNFYPLSLDLASQIRKCWREPSELLAEITPFLSGAPVCIKAPLLDGSLFEFHRANLARIDAVKKAWRESSAEFETLIAQSGVNKRSYSKSSLPKWLNEVARWAENRSLDYHLPKALSKFSQRELAEKTLKGETPTHPVFSRIESLCDEPPSIKEAIVANAIVQCRIKLKDLKRDKNWLSFDDLLSQLAEALRGEYRDILVQRIISQYPVALIDEFQDTDPLQFQIFSTIYGMENQDHDQGLFMIGDPKQAIYAFRGADIFTYIKARREIKDHYTLSTNWRSSMALIHGVNTLFSRASRPFIYDEDIPFLAVQASPGADQRGWRLAGELQPALTIWHLESQLPISQSDYRQQMAVSCAAKIQQIFTLAAQGEAHFLPKERLIKPCDIAVLVRTGHEAALIRDALAAQGIASVYLSSRDSVFASPIALDLLRILRAVLEPQQERLLRAALATLTFGVSVCELEQLSRDEMRWESLIGDFYHYRNLWRRYGILPMLRQLLAMQRIPEQLLTHDSGERYLTDLLHLGELLQQAAQYLDSEYAQVRWFAEQIENPDGDVDEQQLRLESEHNLVQIVTIHKSKGLEYPLVFLPFICSFRPTKQALYHDLDAQQVILDLSPEQANLQLAEQERLGEDLRLLYVALTRAIYGCFLAIAPIRLGRKAGEVSGLHHSAIGWLLQRARALGATELADCLNELTQECSDICLEAPPLSLSEPWQANPEPLPVLQAARFSRTIERNWWITSYSGLLNQGHRGPDASFERPDFEWISAGDETPVTDGSQDDRCIFSFPKGAQHGTFLHTLFERIDFGASLEEGENLTLIEKMLANEQYDPEWLDILQKMLHNVLGCPLDGSELRLRNIPRQKMQVEMEFMFPIHNLHAGRLSAILAKYDPLSKQAPELGFATVNGMLKGFIDLVFEYHGRYYVLDWKSNYLGNSCESYQEDRLNDAMLEHRYDLQYQLYALALHKLLQSRDPNYDYERQFGGVYYLFVRGVQLEGASGIFFARPTKALLDELAELMDREQSHA